MKTVQDVIFFFEVKVVKLLINYFVMVKVILVGIVRLAKNLQVKLKTSLRIKSKLIISVA